MKKLKKSILVSLLFSLTSLAAINIASVKSEKLESVQASFGAAYMANATEGSESNYWAMGAGALGAGSRIAGLVPHPYAKIASWGLTF